MNIETVVAGSLCALYFAAATAINAASAGPVFWPRKNVVAKVTTVGSTQRLVLPGMDASIQVVDTDKGSMYIADEGTTRLFENAAHKAASGQLRPGSAYNFTVRGIGGDRIADFVPLTK